MNEQISIWVGITTLLGVVGAIALAWGNKSRGIDDLQKEIEKHDTRLDAHDALLTEVNRQLAILNTATALGQKNIIDKLDDMRVDLVAVKANCRFCIHSEMRGPIL